MSFAAGGGVAAAVVALAAGWLVGDCVVIGGSLALARGGGLASERRPDEFGHGGSWLPGRGLLAAVNHLALASLAEALVHE
jgi:hypothetical protein